jgi:hypothetical protein
LIENNPAPSVTAASPLARKSDTRKKLSVEVPLTSGVVGNNPGCAALGAPAPVNTIPTGADASTRA